MTRRFFILVGVTFALGVVAALLAFFLLKRAANGALDAATTLASETARGVKEALNVTPRVSVNSLTVVEQSAPIMELALVRKTLFKEYSWHHSFLGSVKTLVLRGVFEAKAGFDLRDSFALDIRSEPFSVRVFLPAARILSLEMKEYRVEKDESGFWNFLTAQDREQAVAAMQREARQTAESSGILEESKREAQKRIEEIIVGRSRTVGTPEKFSVRFE